MSIPRLFFLVPPGPYSERTPNLGDRAHHEGMRSIFNSAEDISLIYDEWNSFPRMNWRRLNRPGSTPAERLQRWYDDYRKQIQRPATVQQKLNRVIRHGAAEKLPLWSRLDRAALRSTGQRGAEAVAPRLLPALYARNFAAHLAASDAVVMNAGGLLADHLVRYLPSRIFALKAATSAGLPTALLNYSFAVSRPELLDWVLPVIRRVDLHAVRESHSRDKLVALGVAPARIVVSPDAAFASAVPAVERRRGRVPVIAIQIRGDRAQNIEAWVSLIEALCSRLDARVVYLVGCQKSDPPIYQRLRARLPFVTTPDEPTLDSLKRGIGLADVLIGDRYHGLVFATQTGTPFVPLVGTTHKSDGLIRDLQYPVKLHQPLGEAAIDPVVSSVEQALDQFEELSSLLRRQANRYESVIRADYREVIGRLTARVAAAEGGERGIS